MTTPAIDAEQLLNQLQHELNRVLEQTGRIFAAANQSKAPPIQQTVRLKQALPDSMNKFHHALDQLEDELNLAQTVMRRDLAVLRAANGSSQPTTNQQAQAPEVDIDMTDADPQPDTTSKDADMQDMTTSQSKPEEPTKNEPEPATAKSAEPPTTSASKPEAGPQPTEPASSKSEEPKAAEEPTTSTDPNPNAEDAQADDPFGPNTANTDLDSIFGESNDNNEFSLDNTDANNNGNDTTGAADGDFDFESFAQSNELIPGLQDYANTHPVNDMVGASDDPEFDAIFGDHADLTASQQNGQQGQGEAPDTTFDDFINDFSMGEYNADGGGDQTFDFGYN